MYVRALFFVFAAVAVSVYASAEEVQPGDKLFDSMPAAETLKSADGTIYKVYEYDASKFKVFEPKNDSVRVEGLGLTATLTIADTGKFRDILNNYWYEHSDPKSALDNACRRIIARSNAPSKADLRKQLHTLYDELK